MNFSTMSYFIALAEERSFTKASSRLGITQQTLSAHIAGVEHELGVRLIIRKVPLELTYAGEVFLGYARRMQDLERSMQQEFQDIAGDERGLLRVGIASTRSHFIMPRSIAAYQRVRPGIEVDLVEEENEELIQSLLAGQLDLIVATVPKDIPGLAVHDLYKEEVVLVVAKELLSRLYAGHEDEVVAEVERKGTLQPLADCPFLLLGKRDIPGDLARQAFRESGITPTIQVTSSNTETLLDLCAKGAGAFFCPRRLVFSSLSEEEQTQVRLIHLGDKALYWINVAWRESDHVWSATDIFYRTLVREVGEMHHEG